MTPAELREAVARAMMEKSPLYTAMTWDEISEQTRGMWLADADAALRVVREAMREPSKAQVAAMEAALSEVLANTHYVMPTDGMAKVLCAGLAASPLREE